VHDIEEIPMPKTNTTGSKSIQTLTSYAAGSNSHKHMKRAVNFYNREGRSYKNSQSYNELQCVAKRFGVSCSSLERHINGFIAIDAGFE